MALDGPAEALRSTLGDRELNGCYLVLRGIKAGRTEGEAYFNLFLERGGSTSLSPVVQGLYFVGRGEHIKPWVEFRYDPRCTFADGGECDLEEEGRTPGLFSLLGELIPPGGSMMAIYGAEPHPVSADTEKGLKRGFPPMATPLGYYLWLSGFRWFKDWYFSEGWLEGGMKLQATRPLDDRARMEREARAKGELEGFIAGLAGAAVSRLEGDALRRARDILSPPGASP